MLQVLERVQRQIKEVAGAAGRVEHREAPQTFEEGAQQPLRLGKPARPRRFRLGRARAVETGGNLGLRSLPFREPGADDHRLDDAHDLVAVGVVRAELRALVRVEPALEERAQYRGVDLRPVERRRFERGLDSGLVQR